MPRKLNAIEIAEGALLADIAIIFQLLIMYLPVGGDVFRFLIPIVFAILVLRRGFYVGIIGLCVAVFVTGLLTGIGPVILMLFEAGTGLFLGLTIATLNLLAGNLGLTEVWKHKLYPIIAAVANWGFTYWWAALYIGMWVFLWPVVIAVYYITNVFVRLLGYDVLPFPGGFIERR